MRFPIIYHIIDKFHITSIGVYGTYRFIDAGMVEPGIATIVVNQQIMMERSILAAPDGTISMGSFAVNRLIEALGNDTPLHGKIDISIKRSAFIGTPADAAMVNDDVFTESASKSIGFNTFFIAHAKTQVSHDDIIGFNGNGEEIGELEHFHKNYPTLCAIATEVPHTYQTRGVYRSQTQWRRRDFPAPWEKGNINWEQFKHRVFPIPDLTEKECFPEESDYPYYQSSYDNASVRISARKSWQRTCSFPWLMGEFRWGSFDYLGEAEWPQRCGNFGIIDIAAIPKDAYFLYQSLWTDKPMVHLLPHWTHPGKEGKTIPVVIYTNCDAVELFINNVSLGSKPYTGEQLIWLVPYSPGKIEARGIKKGKIVATDCYQSAEAPHSVALASNKYSVKAGSDEIIRIEIDITDKNGIPCPYASNELSFHVSGPLRLLGVDNGNPTDMFPYQQPHCRCFRGKCVVLLQSDEEKGKGTLTVQGTKLVEKKLIIEVI